MADLIDIEYALHSQYWKCGTCFRVLNVSLVELTANSAQDISLDQPGAYSVRSNFGGVLSKICALPGDKSVKTILCHSFPYSTPDGAAMMDFYEKYQK